MWPWAFRPICSRRRPDVRRQERLAAAQCEQIGIAQADFYPAISIDGTIGSSAQFVPELWTQPAFTGSIGPALQWKILNYGRIVNNVHLQDAKFQKAVAVYQNTVLKAAAEVEDGLVQFLRAEQRAQSMAVSVMAAEKSVKVALAQYPGGLIDFNRVALVEQNLVQQQDLLALMRGEIALGLVQVYRALGGGWQIRCADDTAAVVQSPPGPSPAAPIAPAAPAELSAGPEAGKIGKGVPLLACPAVPHPRQNTAGRASSGTRCSRWDNLRARLGGLGLQISFQLPTMQDVFTELVNR